MKVHVYLHVHVFVLKKRVFANGPTMLHIRGPDHASHGQDSMPHYDPTRHTTADVVRQVIIPMTKGRYVAGYAKGAYFMGLNIR